MRGRGSRVQNKKTTPASNRGGVNKGKKTMKKLMLGVAVAFAALGLQAATVTWTLTNVYDPSGADLVGNTYKAYHCDSVLFR